MKVNAALDKIREIARDKNSTGNLLEAGIEAARVRCTLGEMSLALEDVFSRHIADNRLVSGAYRKAFNDDKNHDELKKVIQSVEVSDSKSLFDFFMLLFHFEEICQARRSTSSNSSRQSWSRWS